MGFPSQQSSAPSVCACNVEAAAVLSKGVNVDEALQDRGGTLSFPRFFTETVHGWGSLDPWPGTAMAAMALEPKHL